jgi:hypothetical protein
VAGGLGVLAQKMKNVRKGAIEILIKPIRNAGFSPMLSKPI